MENERNIRVTFNGLGFLGSFAAFLLSWTKWHSILWAIFHGLLGWIYVIYYIIIYDI